LNKKKFVEVLQAHALVALLNAFPPAKIHGQLIFDFWYEHIHGGFIILEDVSIFFPSIFPMIWTWQV
jgi:hypothetical protein